MGVVTLEDVIEELIGEEIIDESDVFVDVHKAIRRLAPAPKQRYGRALTLEPTTTNSDSDHEAKESDALLPKDSPSSRKPSLANGNGPGTTFLVRRKSSAGAERISTNTADLRPQLRHLGPSNAASHPRATKFTNVKIKPGVGTIPENKQTTTGVEGDANAPTRPNALGRSQSADVQPTSSEEDEGTRLLRSAGRDASGGAAALRAGYGATESSKPRRMSADQMSAHEASHLAEQKAMSPKQTSEVPNGVQRQDTLKVPDKVVVGSNAEDGDQVGDMSGPPSRQRSTSRRAARSGSITETTVDYGGMKKVVLETTSSSSDVEEGGSNASPTTPVPEQSGSASAPAADGDAEDEGEGEDKGTSAGGGNNAAGGAAGKKKKKKGGKKKKKGGDGGS